jgi:hypothetical protein
MPGYIFPNGIPLVFKVAFGTEMTNIICWVGAGWWAETSAPHRPTGSWTYPLDYRSGTVYLPHLLKQYLTLGIWAHLILLVTLALMLWRYQSTGRTVRVR